MGTKRENDRRNLAKRRERRRKRKMKPKVKLGIGISLVVMLFGIIGGYRFYIHLNDNPFGEIDDTTIVDDEGDIQIETAETATYTVLDVPGGESILIKDGDVEVLIDTGCKESKEKLVASLEGQITGNLDYLIITNDTEKRIGGINAIYKNFQVDKTILGNLTVSKSKLMKLAKKKSVSVEEGGDNSYAVNKSMLTTMRPSVTSKESADRCLVTVFSINGKKLVALSDAGKEEIARCMGGLGEYELVVLAQQGNEAANKSLLGDEGFDSARYIVASCKKSSGFPSEELKSDYGMNLYATYSSGNIQFNIDETGISTDVLSLR